MVVRTIATMPGDSYFGLLERLLVNRVSVSEFRTVQDFETPPEIPVALKPLRGWAPTLSKAGHAFSAARHEWD